jgi:hypothetical protein
MEEQRPPQKLYTKKYGELEVIQSWAEPPNHIALLSNGAYVHITGVPIADKAVLRKTLPVYDLQAALDWFEHRDENKAPGIMRLVIDGDDFVFEDGTQVTSLAQITQALQPGPILEAALSWFTKKQDKEREAVGLKYQANKPPVKAKPQGAAKKKAIQAKKAAGVAATV